MYSHSELVDIITSRFSRERKKLTKPTAFIVVKEKHGEGAWSKVGQTDSIPHSSEPKFSKPVTVAYLGAGVAQHISVEVLSHAPGARNGISLGECTLLLDDLIHARASRVMKLPLTSPDQAHTNGVVVINAVVAAADDSDGLWMQVPSVPFQRIKKCCHSRASASRARLHSTNTDIRYLQLQLAAAGVPRIRAAACGLDLPSSFCRSYLCRKRGGFLRAIKSD